MDRCSETDLSRDFNKFLRSLRPLSLSLPVLYFNREKVLQLLLEELCKPENQSISALCELITSFARDLGASEFVPRFGAVVSAMASLLNSLQKESGGAFLWDAAEHVQPLFHTLGSIMKLFTRSFLSKIETTVAALSPLLSSADARIGELCAEAATGFLIRKSRDDEELRKTLELVLDSKYAHYSLFEGLRRPEAKVGFDVQQQLNLALDLCEERWERFEGVYKALELLANHINDTKEGRGLTELLLARASAAFENSQIDRQTRWIFLLRNWSTFRRGRLLRSQERAAVLSLLIKALSGLDGTVSRMAIEATEGLCSMGLQHPEHAPLVIREMTSAASKGTVNWKLGYYTAKKFSQLTPVEQTSRLLLICINAQAQQKTEAAANGNADETASVALLYQFFSLFPGQDLLNVGSSTASLSSIIQRGLESKLDQSRKFAALLCSMIEFPEVVDSLQNLADTSSDDEEKIQCLKALAKQGRTKSSSLQKDVFAFLKQQPTHKVALEAACELNHLPITRNDLLELLGGNLGSGDSNIRRLTLRLVQMDCPNELTMLYSLCEKIEHVQINVAEIDGTRFMISKLATHLHGSLPEEEITTIACFAIGLMKKRFLPIWNEAGSLWYACYEICSKPSWNVMLGALSDSLTHILNSSKRDANVAEDSTVPGTNHNRENEPELKKEGRKRKAEKSSSSREKRDRTVEDVQKWSEAEYMRISKLLEPGEIRASIKSSTLDSADALAVHVQLLETLNKHPKPLQNRTVVFLLNIFLPSAANGVSMRRSRGDKLLAAQASIIETLGGLRICKQGETEHPGLEDRTRKALLSVLKRSTSSTQTVAIKALLLSRSQLSNSKEMLLQLASDSTFRESMTVLSSEFSSRASISPNAREELVDIVLRVLFGKMNRKGDNQKMMRKICFRFMAENFGGADVEKYLDLALEPLASSVSTFQATLSEKKCIEVPNLADYVSSGLLSGVLHSITDARREMGMKFEKRSWEHVIIAVSMICAIAFVNNSKESDAAATLQSKELRSQSCRALTEALQESPDAGIGILGSLLDHMRDGIEIIQVSGTGVPALLHLISVLSTDDVLQSLVTERMWILKRLITVLGSPLANPDSLRLVLDSLLACLEKDAGEELSSLFTDVIDSLKYRLKNNLQRLRDRRESGVWIAVVLKTTETVGRLSEILVDQGQIQSLLEALIPFLVMVGKKERITRSEEEILEKTMGSVIKLMSKAESHEQLISIYEKVASLFSRAWTEKSPIRASMCKCLEGFRGSDSTIIASLLRSMGAFEEKLDAEPDFGARLKAYGTLIDSLEKSKENEKLIVDSEFVGPRSLVPLLHQGALACVSNDVASRGTASLLLSSFAKRFGSSATRDEKLLVILLELLKEKVLYARSTEIRRESTQVIGEVVRSSYFGTLADNSEQISELHPTLKFVLGLRKLSREDDLEVDFFENIVHVQRHRRARALRRAAQLIEDGEVDPSHGLKFLYPLSLRLAEEDDSTRRELTGTRDRDNEIANASADLAKAIAAKLSWSAYRSLTLTLIKKMKSNTDDSKRPQIASKLLVSVLDVFHFDTVQVVAEKDVELMGEQAIASDPEEEDSEEATAVGTFLVTKLIPALLQRMVVEARGGGVEEVHSGIASAAARLFAKLGRSERDSRLPTLVAPLCNALRSRLNDVRDHARTALANIASSLGSRYLHYIFGEMRSVLEEGFRRHVLGYSVHFMMDKLARTWMDSRWLDSDVVELLFEIYTDELSGSIAEERDAKAPTVAFKEAKSTKAYDVFEIIGEGMDFDATATKIYLLFKERIEGYASTKFVGRMEEALRRLITGMGKNKDLRSESLIRFCLAIIDEHLPQCEKENLRGKIEQSTARDDKAIMARNAHVLVEFALKLITHYTSKGNPSENEENLQMLAAVLNFMPRCLVTRFDSMTNISLRLTQKLLKLQLSSRNEVSSALLSASIQIVSRPGVQGTQTSEALFHSAMRACTSILQEVDVEEASNSAAKRVRALLNIAKGRLEGSSVDTQIASIGFIKAAVQRKIQMPEVYDAADLLSTVAIKSQSSVIRSQAASVSMSFLMNYPLSTRRVRDHVDFFVRNLSYEHPDGRLSSLNAMKGVVQKFPDDFFQKELEFLFVPLAAALSDDNKQCRNAAREALLETMRRAVSAPRAAMAVSRMIQVWIGSETSDLQQTGLRSLAVTAQADCLPISELKKLLNTLINYLHGDPSKWELMYGALVAIEKIVENEKGRTFLCSEDTEDLWESLCEDTGEDGLLLHKHGWVRLVACRLIGLHFAAVGDPSLASNRPDHTIFSKMRNGLVRALMKAFCSQLEAENLSQALAEQSVKNLFYLGSAVKNTDELGDTKGQAEDGAAEQTEHRGLRWLINRIRGLASRAGDHSSLRRASAAKLLTSLLKSWAVEDFEEYDRMLVSVVFSIEEANPVPEEGFRGDDMEAVSALPMISEELKSFLTEKLGGPRFYRLYSEAREGKSKARAERKRKTQQLAGSNPEAAAKRKLKRNLKKKEKRKDEVQKRMLSKGQTRFARASQGMMSDHVE